MISTRTHAAIDYAAVAALAVAAASPRLGLQTRVTLGLAALLRAAVTAATDFEGGAAGRIGMGAHLLLDASGAAGVGLSGLLAPREQRSLLLGLAAADLALAGATERRASDGAPRTTYDPLDTPKPFADGIWVVDSALGPQVPVRMTAIRLGNGDLLLHSPTRYSPGLRAALERLGPIRHLVAPNIVHWTFAKPWQDALPHAELWAAPGLRERGQVRRSGLRIDHVLSERAPAVWGGEIDQVVVPGAAGFSEVAMFHRPSRTLLLTDLVQNWEARKLPWPLRAAIGLLGGLAPVGRAPAHLRAVVRLGHGGAEAARRLVEFRPDRVLLTHGTPWTDDAAARLRQSLDWLLRQPS